MYTFLIFVHVIVCLFLILVVLLQAGKGAGLSNIFGGGGGESLFGPTAGTFLAKLTAFFAALFILTSLSLTLVPRGGKREKSVLEEVLKEEKTTKSEYPANPPLSLPENQ